LYPQYTVKDRDGKTHVLKLKFEDRGKFDGKHFAWGNTVCVLYALKHDFLDGQQGVVCEDVPSIKGNLSDICLGLSNSVAPSIGKVFGDW
jgi:hypothetical protein